MVYMQRGREPGKIAGYRPRHAEPVLIVRAIRAVRRGAGIGLTFAGLAIAVRGARLQAGVPA